MGNILRSSLRMSLFSSSGVALSLVTPGSLVNWAGFSLKDARFSSSDMVDRDTGDLGKDGTFNIYGTQKYPTSARKTCKRTRAAGYEKRKNGGAGGKKRQKATPFPTGPTPDQVNVELNIYPSQRLVRF